MMAPRIIANAGDIIEGVSTNIKDKLNQTTQKESDEIARRRSICEDCPFNNLNAVKRNTEFEQLIKSVEESKGIIIGNDIDLSYKSNRIDLHCSLCGCNIENKTSCLTCNCGIKYFNDTNNTALELKWYEFNK